MRIHVRTVAGVLAVGWAGTVLPLAAQENPFARPFVFTVTPSLETARQKWTVHYDAGYGDRTTQPFGFDGMEQHLGVQGALGQGFTLLGQAGLGLGEGSQTRTTADLELLKDVLGAGHGLRLAVGLGLRREWEGTNVALGRVSLGHTFSASSLFSNLRFERAFETGRDGIDLILTAGWLHRLGSAVHLGVEAVGEDLEGLWEAEEAEGGAKVFFGPSIHLAPPAKPWSASLCGGPVIYATQSSRFSAAPRPLQASPENGYTVRLSLGYAF
jgi:hypothetical protein